ncbi:MAG: PEP-CTERM/exosortase system-associated acyltransferase [Rhodospirillales bacterium]|nr:MAG: PEP-CTERM/exosortase system-associated acyltransferase [Rhodospirillales bacterium]
MLARPELFDALYSVVDADTPALIEEILHLRYKAYCLEHPWLDPNDYPDGLERDGFDDVAIHIALIHRRSRAVVGGVRLVLPEGDGGIDTLPIVELAPPATRPLLSGLPARRTAEVSRFAVSKAFREAVVKDRSRCGAAAGGRHREVERMLMPYATLGLMRGIERHARRHGITHLCAVMEPALMRLLARIGLRFTSLGEPIAFFGVRQPCFMEIAPCRAAVREASAFGYAVITAAPNPAAAMALPAATARQNTPYETGVEAAA